MARDAAAVVFAAAGVLKLRDPRSLEEAIAAGLPHLPVWLRRRSPAVLGVTEIGIALLLVFTFDRLTLVPAGFLLVAFSILLVLLDRRAPDIGCGCLGDFTTGGHKRGVARNLLLVALLITAWLARVPSGIDAASIPPAIGLAILVVLIPEGLALTRDLATQGRAA